MPVVRAVSVTTRGAAAAAAAIAASGVAPVAPATAATSTAVTAVAASGESVLTINANGSSRALSSVRGSGSTSVLSGPAGTPSAARAVRAKAGGAGGGGTPSGPPSAVTIITNGHAKAVTAVRAHGAVTVSTVTAGAAAASTAARASGAVIVVPAATGHAAAVAARAASGTTIAVASPEGAARARRAVHAHSGGGGTSPEPVVTVPASAEPVLVEVRTAGAARVSTTATLSGVPVTVTVATRGAARVSNPSAPSVRARATTGLAPVVSVDTDALVTLDVPVVEPPGGTVDPVTGESTPPLVPVETAYPASPVVPFMRNSLWMADPATILDPATGRPRPDLFVEDTARSVVETLGRLRVVVGGKDVTFFRGAPTRVGDIVREEPFGAIQASLRFESVTPFERYGTGDTQWLRDAAWVDIEIVRPSGARLNLFSGFVPSVEDALTSRDSGVELTCVGSAFQADYLMHEPPLWMRPADLGTTVAAIMNGCAGRRFGKITAVTTGIPVTDRGSLDESRMERVRGLLGLAWTDDGARQWTLRETSPRRFAIVLKVPRKTWTVSAGTPGVNVRLTRDLTQAPNALKGSGVDSQNRYYSNLKTPGYVPGRGEVPYPFANEGQTFTIGVTHPKLAVWQAEMRRNGYRPGSSNTYSSRDAAACRDLQEDAGLKVDGSVGPQTWNETFSTGRNGGTLSGAYHAPLAIDRRVEPNTYTASGAVRGKSSAYRKDVLRVESWTHYADGTSKPEAVRTAKAMLARNIKEAYVGTVTLNGVDPREGARAEIREGDVITVLGHKGKARALTVAKVEQSWTGDLYSVSLTVDTLARDAMTLDAIMKRARDAKDVAKRPSARSRSQQAAGKPLLDSELVGWVTDTPAFPGLWCKSFVPLGQEGTITRVELQTSPPTEFAAMLVGEDMKPSAIASIVPDPLAASAGNWFSKDEAREKWMDDHSVFLAWGTHDGPCGYNGGGKAEGGRLTGRHVDGSGASFAIDAPPWATLLVYTQGPCTVTGRVYLAPEA